MIRRLVYVAAVAAFLSFNASAQHRVLVIGDKSLSIVAPDAKTTEWEMPWRGIHDIHLLPDGHILTVQDFHQVVEIDPATKQVVWSYDSATSNGNAGKPVEIHAIQPLEGGRIMIAESGPGRIIEIERDGTLVKEVKLKLDSPMVHRDTRLARKIGNGNYLVCHEGDGAVREYDGKTGTVVWEFPVPLFGQERKDGHGPEAFGNQCFSAVRLENGNTLIGTGNGHSILEVTPAKEIVWELHQKDLPGITLAWVTTLEVLPNGHLVFGNCHAGPGQPLLIEIDRKTRNVLWTFDRFETFGNSVTNSVLMDLAGRTIR
jgi:outer membrane protein assembly factor BamB